MQCSVQIKNVARNNTASAWLVEAENNLEQSL